MSRKPEAIIDSFCLCPARVKFCLTIIPTGPLAQSNEKMKKEMREEHMTSLRKLLDAAGAKADVSEFKRYGSARKLYHFHVDNAGQY